MKLQKRPAVSEVVAALLLIAITVAAFGVFYTYYVNGLKTSGNSVSQGIQNSAKAAGELMSLPSYTVTSSSGQIVLYIYNYGTEPITLVPPSEAYIVVSGAQQKSTSFALVDASSGSSITTVQTQKLAQLTLTFSSVPSSGSFYVDIVDSIGKTFEFQLSAS